MGRDRFVKWGARQSRMKRQLRNPYFQNHFHPKRGIRLRGLKSFAISLAVALVLCVIALLPFELLTQPYFHIQNTTYELDTVIPARQIAIRAVVDTELAKKTLYNYLSKKSYFLLSTTAIQSEIEKTGFYAKVVVKKKFPHSLIVAVQEPNKLFLADDGKARATLTESGEVVDVYPYNDSSSTNKELPAYIASSSLMTVRIDRAASSSELFILGQKGISKNCATLITSLQSGMKEVGMSPQSFHINKDETTVTIAMQNNWQLITDPIMAAQDQLQRLMYIFRNPTYKDTSHVSYIDVRFPDKVYIKTR